MGMVSAFDALTAEFSGLTGRKDLFISASPTEHDNPMQSNARLRPLGRIRWAVREPGRKRSRPSLA